MKVCFEDIGHMSATFAAESGEAGQVVKMVENGKVAPCADGEEFCGVMEGIRKGYTAVQLHGFVTLGYTGTAPAVGYGTFAADANGGIKAADAGRKCLVVHVDTDKMTATIEL